jgi:hypothetical protein
MEHSLVARCRCAEDTCTKINCPGCGYPQRGQPCQRRHPPGRARSAQPRASPRRVPGVPIAYENRLAVADALATTIKLASSASVLSVVSPLPRARPRSPTRTAPLCLQAGHRSSCRAVRQRQGNQPQAFGSVVHPTLAPVRAWAGTTPAGSSARCCRTPSSDWPPPRVP